MTSAALMREENGARATHTLGHFVRVNFVAHWSLATPIIALIGIAYPVNPNICELSPLAKLSQILILLSSQRLAYPEGR
jgi:hypothetical protein